MRRHAVRRCFLVVAVGAFAAVSTVPAQPPTATYAEAAERLFPAMTVAASPFGLRGTVVERETDRFQDLLETRVAELRDDTGLTAVAVAATTDGELAGIAASGERRRDSGISVTVDDRWHMGSITKSMTATLLAVLEEDGLLSADDVLTALLPDLEMADGWSVCTLDHLLTHTAGVARNFPAEFQDVWPETAEKLVAERRRFTAEVLSEEPEAPCGERFLYSNLGYTIAGHIAETVAGEPYEALIQNRVFGPLALMSAGFGAPKGEYPNQEPIGHYVLPDGGRLPIDPFETRADNSPLIAPAGTAHMTIGDLARYGATHLDGEYGSDPVLLSQVSWQRLHAPFLNDYARGWVRYERDWAGGPVIWHNGSNTLWYAVLYLLPARNMALALVTNDGASEVADAAFYELAQELIAASDPTGSSGGAESFSDDPIQPGLTPVKAVHFTELRTRIDALRRAAGLPAFPWAGPVLTAGVTRVRLVHLLDLREALGAVYAVVGRPVPAWTDAAPAAGTTPIRAAHLMELRAAVLALE